jgi:hypothetical protein
MPRLADGELYRRVCPADILDALGALDRLNFFATNRGGPPEKFPCEVAMRPFPPEIEAVVQAVPFGGRLARAIVRRLEPFQSVGAHIDTWMGDGDWRRFHIPLVTDSRVIMRWPDDGAQVHLETGYVWEVNFSRLHEIVNGWDGRRVHIQVDVVDATI